MNKEEFNDGYNQGVKDTVLEIADMYKMNEFPEDLELDIADWLIKKGVKYDY